MSNRAYVAVKDGRAVEVARPLQGSLTVYPAQNHFMRPVIDHAWASDGVWFARLSFRGLKARVSGEPKKVNVPKKVRAMEKRVADPTARAGTACPGIRGYQQRANAAASAQSSRRREAKGLLSWLKQHTS